MRDFGIIRYCEKCGLEIIFPGEYVTMSEGDKFCECKKKVKKND